MKKLMSIVLCTVMVALLAACGSAPAETTTAAAAAPAGEAAAAPAENLGIVDPAQQTAVKTKVGLITMDQMDVHWVRLKKAAEERVAEYNALGSEIEMVWMAPETKDNAQQIQKIEAAIAEGVNYIIIACNDATSSNKALQEALDFGIKIIYVDAPATVEASATYATDNFHGGVLAGEYLLKVLTDAGLSEGKIGIVDAQTGVESCENRYQGFASVFKDTAFTLGERQYSDGDNAKAQELANTLIADGVIAIYGTNDGATNGSASAVKDDRANGGNVYCVGWDRSDSNLAHVESGALLAFMAQNPNVMGIDAIDAVVQLENGADLKGEVVDTGVSVVDSGNVADFK